MPTRKKSSTRKRKPQKGRGILSTVHRIVKNNKLISRGLALTPLAPLAGVADMLGYGKRKRKSTRRVRRVTAVSGKRVPSIATIRRRATRSRTVRVPRPSQMGRGIFTDIGGGVGSVFGGLGSGVGSIAHGLFGAGRKPKGNLSGKKYFLKM